MRIYLRGIFAVVLSISSQALFSATSNAEDLIIGNGQVYRHDGSPDCRKYDRIIIGADGVWVIGSSSLCAEAQQMEVGPRASIVAFTGTSEQWAARGVNGVAPGQGGSPGDSGLAAGSVRLHLGTILLKDPKSPLAVDLVGQVGGYGGHGARGAQGAPGAQGSPSKEFCHHIRTPDGIDVICSCKAAGGPGQPGGPGGRGGEGGPGGAGGDGGNLTLILKRGDPRALVVASLKGNRGETGGEPGAGGPGGPGGQGGSGSSECTDGESGPDGPAGEAGLDRTTERAPSGSDGKFSTQ